MKLSVVIPALDESAEVAGAIESAASAPGSNVEILVVDGGSRDDTAVRAKRAGARVLQSQPGRARQLQAGFAASDGDVLLFLHADSRLPSGWDEALRRCLEDPGRSGGAFRFRFDAHPGPLRGLALRIVEWGARRRAALFGLPYGDQAIFVRREVLAAIGGVPRVPLMEDLDLARAIKAHGRLVLLGASVTTSPRRYLASGVLRTAWLNGLAAFAWWLGLDRARVAAWYRRRSNARGAAPNSADGLTGTTG